MSPLLSSGHWHSAAIWLISLCAITLVLVRPKKLAEAWWAVAGALLLVVFRLSPLASAARAVGKGLDVYLFLTGMMIMSELARREGVFDWVAGHACSASRGSPRRLFLLIYGVGTFVTIFLSNDATAVVLTPAVLASVREAEAEPLPFLLTCAFIANAASFVLPISNPANLVVYGSSMPPLGSWLAHFGLPSIAAVLVTYFLLRLLMRRSLQGTVRTDVTIEPLSRTGKLTLYGIGFLAAVLMVASALNVDLGAPACAAGMLVALAVTLKDHSASRDIVKEISWSVLPLVAGLFVIVEAMNTAGALAAGVHALQVIRSWPPLAGALASGFGVAVISNLMNNLPVGLIAGSAVNAAHLAGPLRDSVLVGVDLGPNISVTGSLATILWLIALRRENQEIGFWRFLRYGAIVTPPALVAAVVLLLLR